MEKVNKKMKEVKSFLRQEIKFWPKWARITVTMLIVTGFFLTAAATIVAVRKFKKKKN